MKRTRQSGDDEESNFSFSSANDNFSSFGFSKQSEDSANASANKKQRFTSANFGEQVDEPVNVSNSNTFNDQVQKPLSSSSGKLPHNSNLTSGNASLVQSYNNSNNQQPFKRISPERSREIEMQVSIERERILKEQGMGNSSNKELHVAFNDLQSFLREFSVSIEIPELVVVGMQSDGKSSFIEALLGFQFNTVDTQIGTRRPLVLQMIQSDEHEDPKCFFFEENMGALESEPTPTSQMEKKIRQRTDALCKNGSVSATPITIRIFYKYCANLTVYDTPGFRKGENDPLGPAITRMVLNMIEPANRIIVALEQSTVEWCNTQVRPIVQKVDPMFKRTVFITTKFNNRCNQFKNKDEVEPYLDTDNQINSENVFFISLPSGPEARDLTAMEFKQNIIDSYLSDFIQLCKLGGVSEKHMKRIGFHKVKKYLESLLTEKFKENCSPVREKIEESIDSIKSELNGLDKQLKNMEKEDVEQNCFLITEKFIKNIESVVSGTPEFETAQYGFTTMEEREKCNTPNWSGYLPSFVSVLNDDYKLYGGAQISRLCQEFLTVLCAQEFPKTDDQEIVVAMGLDLFAWKEFKKISVVKGLAKKKSSVAIMCILEEFFKRLKFVVFNILKIVPTNIMEVIQSEARMGIGHRNEFTNTTNYNSFLAKLQETSYGFYIKNLEESKIRMLGSFINNCDRDDLEVGGGSGLGCANCMADFYKNYDYLEPTEEQIMDRINVTLNFESTPHSSSSIEYSSSNIMKHKINNGNDVSPRQKVQKKLEIQAERCREIKIQAAKSFSVIRDSVVTNFKENFNNYFIKPLTNDMAYHIRQFFKNMNSSQLKELMGLQISKIKEDHTTTEQKLKKITESLRAFDHLLLKVCNNNNK